jgi:hypothetical protein
MTQPKTVTEMVGETLREGALLLIVFGGVLEAPARPTHALTVAIGSTLILVVGMIVERRRVR